ncbi:MAG: glycosyltransferase family 9 protein [Deltaproteobacteria bacterium]|nr:glycosyltransferase family 9 protein [Deltaproteobacteria bacterium]
MSEQKLSPIIRPKLVPAKILIVRLGAVGDVIQALPALYALRNEYPRSHIAWVVEEQAAEIVKAQPEVDEVFVFERRKLRNLFKLGTAAWAFQLFKSFIRLLRGRKFSLAIDLHNIFRSGLISKLSRAPARLVARPSREGNWFFNNWRFRLPKSLVHTTDRHVGLLRKLGVKREPEVPRVPIDPADREFVQTFFERKKLDPERVVVIHPGANWSSKRWPEERYGELAERLNSELDYIPVITWGPGEEHLAKRVVKLSHEKAVMAYPTTLKQLASLCKSSRLFVGPDTGPLHLASAVGTPSVALYGPTSPARFSPRGGKVKIVARDIKCSGCMRRKCRKLDCMKRITVHEVFMVAREMVGSA